MSNNGEETSHQPDEVSLPVSWVGVDKLPTVYANQLLISHSGREFYLFFGEIVPPAIIDLPGNLIPAKLEVKPVAKIAISYEAMPEFLQVLTTNYQKFRERMEKKK